MGGKIFFIFGDFFGSGSSNAGTVYLLRYHADTQQFVPYAQGISADHITYSRDGQWMAYVEFPKASWCAAAWTEVSGGN